MTSTQAFAHGDHHKYENAPGGLLLEGYPWGVFSNKVDFNNRVKHLANDQEIQLANKIFEKIAKYERVAFPLFLENQGYKPFGDGQSNGQANFAFWSEGEPPLVVTLNKEVLKVEFHSSLSLPQGIKILFPNQVEKSIQQDLTGEYKIQIDSDKLGWNKISGGNFLYIKPAHWNDWFPIKMQNPYIHVQDLVKNIPTNVSKTKIPNPVNLDADLSTPPLIQLMKKYKAQDYLLFTTDKVHSVYPKPGANSIEKTSGGNWTFLLNPTQWQGPQASTFKQLYSCFEGRAYWEESMKKSVSGTSWHHVGDEGEIILNSVENEDRSLVAGVGEAVTPPAGIKLAYGLNYVGYASKVSPGSSLVSIKGTYHWHPIHTTKPICVEVWTPPCVPSEQTGYGFQCQN